MSNSFVNITKEKLDNAIVDILYPRVVALLDQRGLGHCMRVSDLDDSVMEGICKKTKRSHPVSNIYMLDRQSNNENESRISSTKLVELRNPDENGSLRDPLIVFIPNTMRTSAEDSFGIATFEEIAFVDVYDELLSSLIEQIPTSLVNGVTSIFEILEEQKWQFADQIARVKFLMTALENGIDGETLGASLFELTLIPDFKLFEDASYISSKIRRNVGSVQSLISSYKSVRRRIAGLELSDKVVESTLMRYFDKFDVTEPDIWTKPIAFEKQWWGLSFDKWRFKEEIGLDSIRIDVIATDLPIVTDAQNDDQFMGLLGQQILLPKERKKINTTFEVSIHPSKIRGLDNFTAQIISKENGPVGKAKKVKTWAGNKLQCSFGILKLDKVEFEEGWHFVRILPWTSDGDPIPMGLDFVEGTARLPYESDLFYVLPTGKLEEVPPQRSIPIEQSLEHAMMRLQFIALNDEQDPDKISTTDIAWNEGDRNRRVSKLDNLIIRFGSEGSYQINISKHLRGIESRILSNPKHPSGWRMQINANSAESPSEVGLQLPNSTAMQSFLSIRENLFGKIQKGSSDMLVQSFLFKDHENECIAYAEAYTDLVKNQLKMIETTSGRERQLHLQSLRSILSVDSVHVVNKDFRGHYNEAVLVSPTHPLKIQWYLCWAKQGQKWINEIKNGSKDSINSVRYSLLEELSPLGFPVAMPVEDGRIFIPIDNLTPFWSVYGPANEENPQGLVSDLCRSLGLKEQSGDAAFSGNIIADKIDRYLSQHPYVRELSLNVFNPGSGVMIADALLSLQNHIEYNDLRYDIRLFSSCPDSPNFGEAIENLTHPDTLVNEAADAFASSSGSHLFSKLRIAKHSIEEFVCNVEKFQTHISILMDVFPAEAISVSPKPYGAMPLNGLIQDHEIEYFDDEAGAFWTKYPIFESTSLANEHDGENAILSNLARSIAHGTSAVATSGVCCDGVPIITLGLNSKQRELIYEVHKQSDWVFTIDRNMGIEFYDHGGKKKRPDYLIDYVPNINPLGAHGLIISSRSNDELEALLRPVLTKKGLSASKTQSIQLLTHLRSLSGQLALKLISAPTQQSEALGLALARIYLEYQGALKDQIIVPLDAHTSLYRTNGVKVETSDELSLRRTDLALFDFNYAERIITCNLVEVKCYSNVGELAAYNLLKEDISTQINQSERILQRHFDPALKKPDRPDRKIKSREFSKMLRFYLDRALRYAIIEKDAAQEAILFLKSIENGYSLQFRRCALIFDFEKGGTDAPEMEVGIEYHRIGKDTISNLLDNCSATETIDTMETSLFNLSIQSVPKLISAAFIAPGRQRTTALLDEESNWTLSNDTGEAYSTREFATEDKNENLMSEELIPNDNDHQCIKPIEKDGKEISDEINIEEIAVVEVEHDEHPDQNSSASTDKAGKSSDAPYDIMLGVSSTSPQYGLLGEVSGRKVALDLNQTHTISLFGVQGGGKSYTLGSIIEMASMNIDSINVLPSPLATVIFHYSPTQDYAPEFTSMIRPNSKDDEIGILRDHYQANPEAMKDILILTPADKVDERKREFPNIEVKAIAFSASELKAAHWKFLMGAVGSQSMYLKQINLIMRSLRNNLTLRAIEDGIESSGLTDQLKDLARIRLKFANEYIDDNQRLQDLIRPGRLVIVDLRDEYIEKSEALGLFVVMLQIFSEATFNGETFNKLVVFDEAHKYIDNDDLVTGLVEVVREMRHKGTSIMVASQDPPSVPISLIELSTQIIMHKFNSPAWLKHIQKSNAALGDLTSEKMSRLGTGEAYVWSSKASDDAFSKGTVKIKCRPRVTQHGGSTKTAVED